MRRAWQQVMQGRLRIPEKPEAQQMVEVEERLIAQQRLPRSFSKGRSEAAPDAPAFEEVVFVEAQIPSPLQLETEHRRNGQREQSDPFGIAH